MAYDKSERGSVFVASLGEVKPPPEIEARVAGEIQAAVMRGLAAVDFEGEVNTQFPRNSFLGAVLKASGSTPIRIPR